MFHALWLIFASNPDMIVRPWGRLGSAYKVNERGFLFYRIAVAIPLTLIPLSFVISANHFVFHLYYIYFLLIVLLTTYLFLSLAIRNGRRVS